MPCPTARLPARCLLLMSVAALAACASRPQHAATGQAAAEDVVTVHAGPHGHRFDMQQGGRSMTAEEFDAWMKARGIRVATGAPAKPKASGTAARRAR